MKSIHDPLDLSIICYAHTHIQQKKGTHLQERMYPATAVHKIAEAYAEACLQRYIELNEE